MSKKEEIKPCPFCGCKGKLKFEKGDFYGYHYYVECVAVRCGVNPRTTPCDHKGVERGRDGAIKSWNRRKSK